MPLFELEEGRLVPAQFGRTVEGALSDELLESVRAQVLEIIARPLFPVTWRDLSRSGSEGSPRLTALDATGQVVSIEVVDHLTSQRLIAALSALADTASKSWTDLAHEYPGGIPHFRVDWLAFRDSMPPSPGAGPRLIMVVGSIDSSARAALEVLVASGVEVHEISLRQMSNGRSFLSVSPVGRRVYAHTPQIVGHATDVPVIAAPKESSALSESESTVMFSPHSSVSEGKDVLVEATKAKERPQPSRRDPHAYRHAAPVYPRVGRTPDAGARHAQEAESEDVQVTSSVELPDEQIHTAVSAVSLDSDDREHRGQVAPEVAEAAKPPFEFPSRLSRRLRDTERASAGALFPPRRGDLRSPERTEREVPEYLLRRGRREHIEAQVHDAASAQDFAVALEPNGVGLEALALMFGKETRLYLSVQGSEHVPVVLTQTGRLRVWHREFTSMDEAMAYAGCRGVDGWGMLRVGDVNGQTLGNALSELNAAVLNEGTDR